jgi:hypothetical protein
MLLLRPRCARLFSALALSLLLLAVANGCRSRKSLPTEPEGAAEAGSSSLEAGKSSAHAEPHLPRRLLFIHVSNYAFLPRLTAADGSADRTREGALHLAQLLKISTPKGGSKFTFLSDTTVADGKTLTRDTIVEAYQRFFDFTQPEDHIVVYLGGHGLELDGKAYFVPMEGDTNNPKILLPVDDFYAKLKACHAAQKVVIWDVCRLNPERTKKRGAGSDAMTASLAKLLAAAPEGVEVVTSCQPGENALELTSFSLDSGASTYSGSVFLEAIRSLNENSLGGGKAPATTDPIPVADLVTAAGKRVAEVAGRQKPALKQTVQLVSKKVEPKSTPTTTPVQTTITPTSKKQAPPSKAVADEALAIAEEFRVPPLAPGQPVALPPDTHYRDDLATLYRSTVSVDEIRKNKSKYEFQNATLNAFQTLRDVWVFKAKGGLQRRETIASPISNDLKREIKKEQEVWASGIAKLEVVDSDLEKFAAKKKDQPKRWQAHYDYARALVKQRLAYMNEYDKLMGDVQTETLPPLDKTIKQDGYRLTPNEKMKSKKDIQKYAEDAREAFEGVIADHKDTPWAAQAKADLGVNLGLLWQPIVRGK